MIDRVLKNAGNVGFGGNRPPNLSRKEARMRADRRRSVFFNTLPSDELK
jgi:hypothetical protein